MVGRAEPVELDLAGNAWRDLAGRRLEFVNPEPNPADLTGLGARQTGTVGDITASRKVKVPDIPMSQIGEYYAAKKKWTWHWGNSLYLEWFSTGNGRVVIESATFQLTISPDIAWDMTPAEEETQRGANAEAMGGFVKLGEAADDDTAIWDEPKPNSRPRRKDAGDSDRLRTASRRTDREGPDATTKDSEEEPSDASGTRRQTAHA